MVRDLEAMACVIDEVKVRRAKASAVLTVGVTLPVTSAQARQIARDSGVPLPEEGEASGRGPRVVGLKMKGPDAPCDVLFYDRSSGRKLWEGRATVGKYDLGAGAGYALAVKLTVEETEVDCDENGQPLAPELRDRHRFVDLVDAAAPLALDLAWSELELPFDELDRVHGFGLSRFFGDRRIPTGDVPPEELTTDLMTAVGMLAEPPEDGLVSLRWEAPGFPAVTMRIGESDSLVEAAASMRAFDPAETMLTLRTPAGTATASVAAVQLALKIHQLRKIDEEKAEKKRIEAEAAERIKEQKAAAEQGTAIPIGGRPKAVPEPSDEEKEAAASKEGADLGRTIWRCKDCRTARETAGEMPEDFERDEETGDVRCAGCAQALREADEKAAEAGHDLTPEQQAAAGEEQPLTAPPRMTGRRGRK